MVFSIDPKFGHLARQLFKLAFLVSQTLCQKVEICIEVYVMTACMHEKSG